MEDTGTAVVDAPASTGSSAPDTTSSTPTEPTVTTDRPSIGEALSVFNEAAKQQGRKPRGVKPADAPLPITDGTTPEATAATVAPAVQTPKGPIPFEVHDTALKNARAKERAVVEQEYGAPPAVAREATQWFQRAAQDRVGFLRDVINEALSDPQLGPQVLSLAGQTLSGNRGQAPPVTSEEPQPDFQDANGNQFYSAKAQQAREAWLINKAKEEILGQVQPDLEQVRSDREARQQEAQQRAVTTQIHSHITEASKWPYFDKYKAEIAEVARAMPLTSGHPAEEAIVLRRAYDQVVGPKFSQLEQERVVADLKSRAHASSLNPASTGAPSGVPKNVRAKDGGSFGNALKWAADQQSGR